jgi:rhodanese-related sulfurtransferase
MPGFFDRLWGKEPEPEPEPDPELAVSPFMEVHEVGALELKTKLASEEPPLLLDVREPYEWQDGGIPGAVQMPMNTVPQRMNELPRDREIVAYCEVGERSWLVADFLMRNGFSRVSNLGGGMIAWQMLKWRENK